MDLLQKARTIINQVDAQMAELFVQRMRAAEMVAQYKKIHALPILDRAREEAVIRRNAALVEDAALRGYYIAFLQETMALSRQYQHRLMEDGTDSAQLPVEIGYPIFLQRGILSKADTYLNLNRKVLVVTDTGVPAQYARTVAERCANPVTVTLPQGEGSKNLQNFELLCRTMLQHGFTRTDCVVAVGGGVVGDLAGFAAASFMRGIDFYNIPTTVLSQVDSSVGGKVAMDMDGIKNCVGAFYPPKAVLIDPEVLKTLPQRQISNGLAEAVKMAVTFDETLLSLFEREDYLIHIDEIIASSLRIKAGVVKEDEKESGLRRVLNFGHTIGHGIESASGMDELYHGECVALGMLPMCSDDLRPRVKAILQKLNLPTTCSTAPERVWEAMYHDKKLSGDTITLVYAPSAGNYELRSMPIADLKDTVWTFLEKRE